VIRRAGPTDLDALLRLVAEFYAVDGHPHDEEVVRRALVPLLEDDRFGVVWLIGDEDVGEDAGEDAGGPAGYAVVTWSYALESGGRDALLDEIYVRGRGVGTGGQALDAILADCRRRGITKMFLETEAGNERGRTFYARHGFAVEDSIWMCCDL
jgi:GNAT superfamily N-acetyltransferase